MYELLEKSLLTVGNSHPGVPGPFSAKNRYDVRLVNRRAAGVCLLLDYSVYRYLFMAQIGPDMLVLG